MNNVFVYCEVEGTTVAEVSQELLTKGRKLANQQGVELHAIVAGTGIKGQVEDQILPYGVDKLFVFDAEGLFPYTSAPHTDILVNLFKEEKPQIALMGATVIGRDLGPRVSSSLTSGHLHTIVLGGGLDAANKWKDKGKKFFFPVKVMSAVFKKYYLCELKQLWEEKKLEYHGTAAHLKNHYEFKVLLNSLYDKNWVVYTKEAFNGANSVIRYLGRYTHRIAISNRRIVSMTDETVTYLVKDYKNGGKYIEQTIKGTEFLRMFLMHVLPKGFVRIRHYGLLSCRNKKEKMAHCRKLLNCIQYISKLRGKTCAEKLMILYKKDICKCEACGGNLLSLSLRGHYMLT